jgi:hypothetical protein
VNLLDTLTRALEAEEESTTARRNAVRAIIAVQRAHMDANERKELPPELRDLVERFDDDLLRVKADGGFVDALRRGRIHSRRLDATRPGWERSPEAEDIAAIRARYKKQLDRLTTTTEV